MMDRWIGRINVALFCLVLMLIPPTLTKALYYQQVGGTSSGGITNAAGNNVITKSNGTNLVASGISDDGTLVSTTEKFAVGTSPSSQSAGDGSEARSATTGVHWVGSDSNSVCPWRSSDNNIQCIAGTGATQHFLLGASSVGGANYADLQVTSGKLLLNNTNLSAPTYLTNSNCSSSASPAVCGSAAAGSVALPTGAVPTLVVNTSAVTANSLIFLNVDESLGSKLSVTCNSTLSTLLNPVVTARSAGISFTFTINATIAVNPACISYFIVN